mmetsp:Transcript_9897/g.14886  ORF Transcript_9897/g.14886 Transcript_9897/m.14886 type:complete len:86 (-) Transcript_9897:80-337(-)
MGGDPKFPYPKKVWSTTGGWWPSPVHGVRNALRYSAIGVALLIPVAMWAESKTKYYNRWPDYKKIEGKKFVANPGAPPTYIGDEE